MLPTCKFKFKQARLDTRKYVTLTRYSVPIYVHKIT